MGSKKVVGGGVLFICIYIYTYKYIFFLLPVETFIFVRGSKKKFAVGVQKKFWTVSQIFLVGGPKQNALDDADTQTDIRTWRLYD